MSVEAAYQLLYGVALVWFSLLIFAMLVRSILGPRITDRILSVNMIGTMVICCILILSRMLRESFLLDVALIYAMISFLSVLILANVYIRGRRRRNAFGQQVERELAQEKKERKKEEGGDVGEP